MKRIIEIGRSEIVDEDPDPSYLEQPEFADRLAEYRRGYFHYVGISAVAIVEVDGVRQTIHSGGLWGIESDSGEAYFDEVYAEQREELGGILAELGFTLDEIAV